MPKERKLVDKFKLIESLGLLQKAVEDDLIDSGTISFKKQPSGVYSVTVVYEMLHETKNKGTIPK